MQDKATTKVITATMGRTMEVTVMDTTRDIMDMLGMTIQATTIRIMDMVKDTTSTMVNPNCAFKK